MSDILYRQTPGGEPPVLDMDPARWRPQYYETKIELSTNIDSVQIGNITLNNQPFVLQRVTHQIIGATAAGPLFQDGNYLIDWKDDSTSYQNSAAMADAMFGSVRTGNFLDLPAPIVYPSSKTLTVRVSNVIARTPADTFFKIQVIFHGIEQWAV